MQQTDRYCSGAWGRNLGGRRRHRPRPPPAETFAISAELARGVRNAILLAGYESETADIKATDSAVPFLRRAAEFEMNAELRCIVFKYLL